MTKAKARERAKAKAAQKIKKRQDAADQPDQELKRGQFDPGSNSIKGPHMSTGVQNFGGARRGAARSK